MYIKKTTRLCVLSSESYYIISFDVNFQHLTVKMVPWGGPNGSE